ncbi:hypothetical protein SteCoe_34493 [Stentor coeruleus]|uniref:LITAF domain-containing protein n=1 Tax=Stentor coeruleus TaxID=5963 RepID=A0A1R2AUL4_9CILI|nr:hypothetical protein SteCoe_34493 [Stentor coeruleus]
MNALEINYSAKAKFSQESNMSPDTKNHSESLNSLEFSLTRNKLRSHGNEISIHTYPSQNEPTSSIVDNSDLVAIRPPKIGERVSTVLMTSESVLSRNRLHECSVHLERLCEHTNTVAQSKKFEEKVQIEEIPELHRPVFTTHPTVAFCNRCGRDVKTKIVRVEQNFFGVKFNEILCCFAKIFGEQEILHVCSRCRNQLFRITL